jgi:hypothetical protein
MKSKFYTAVDSNGKAVPIIRKHKEDFSKDHKTTAHKSMTEAYDYLREKHKIMNIQIILQKGLDKAPEWIDKEDDSENT